MSTFSSLKLVAAKRPTEISPVVQRRNRLISKIWEQTELAKAQQDGKTFAPLHFRTIKDAATGESRRIETPKRVKAWWFTADSGKLCMSVPPLATSNSPTLGRVKFPQAGHADCNLIDRDRVAF